MKYIDLKNFRILLLFSIFIAISVLFSAVYFIVTNSDAESFIQVGQSQIGFDNEEFSSIDFELSGDSLWFVSSTNANTSLYSFKSGNITHNQNSTISIDLNIMESSYMGFNYKVDSEYSTSGDEFYDGLKYYINGELIDQFQPKDNGNSSWQYYEKFIGRQVKG